MNKEDILKLVEDEREDVINLCSKLLQIPSENPPGNSTEVSAFIKSYLNENGIETVEYEPDPKRFNIIASIGKEGGKELIYCGHSDTVPVGDLSKWDFNPFSGEVKDGLLLGRGASDMKGGLAGILFAAVFLKKHGIELDGKLTLAVVPDEETGSGFGAPWLLENGKIKGDGCLIAEPSGQLNPTIGQKGSGSFKLTVRGIPGHASLSPLIGRSAIMDTIKAIEFIRDFTEKKIPQPDDVKELVAISAKNAIEEKNSAAAGVFERCSFNVGTISGGTASNVIADKCVVSIDSRLPFGIKRHEFLSQIKDGLNKLGIDYDLEEEGFKSNANYTPAYHPICKSVVDNIKYVRNTEEAYGVLQWACSDARHFREHDIPVLQYGPSINETIHNFNERVKVEDLVACAKVYVLAAIDFLNGVKGV